MKPKYELKTIVADNFKTIRCSDIQTEWNGKALRVIKPMSYNFSTKQWENFNEAIIPMHQIKVVFVLDDTQTTVDKFTVPNLVRN